MAEFVSYDIRRLGPEGGPPRVERVVGERVDPNFALRVELDLYGQLGICVDQIPSGMNAGPCLFADRASALAYLAELQAAMRETGVDPSMKRLEEPTTRPPAAVCRLLQKHLRRRRAQGPAKPLAVEVSGGRRNHYCDCDECAEGWAGAHEHRRTALGLLNALAAIAAGVVADPQAVARAALTLPSEEVAHG